MSFLYLAGLNANLFTQASTYSSSSEDSNYPVENVGDGITGNPFKFSSAGTDDTITIDLGSSQSATFVSVHGHNIDSGVTAVQLRKSTDNFAANDVLVATLTVSSPTFFATFTSTSSRYWRIKFVGTNSDPIEIGELGLGVHSALATGANQIKITSLEIEALFPQNRQSGSLVPQVTTAALTTHRQRVVTLGLRTFLFTQRDTVEGWLVTTSGGAEPFICVPDDDDVVVVHGRLPERVKWQRAEGANQFQTTSVTIEEDSFSIKLAT